MTVEHDDTVAATRIEAPTTNRRGRKPGKPEAPLPFEAKLWAAADKLRGQLEESEYKHVVLGLVFLKFVSDSFERRRAEVAVEIADPESDFFRPNPDRRVVALEERDFYIARRVAWVPVEARWSELRRQAKQADIGVLIDTAMDLIERENPSLRGVLPKIFARPDIEPRMLGELIDLFGSVDVHPEEGSTEDVLGRVYEYFLNRFGTNEGGQYYTPQQVVRLLVEMLEPHKGRVLDPCCGSGGMFIQSLRFVEEHEGRHGDIRVFGQEAVPATWRLAKMNLAIRHIEGDLADSWGDSFHNDKHPDLRADFVLANPPFNDSDWGGDRLRDDKRWEFGAPPVTNANFGWVQNFVHHLAPSGTAGFVLANGALSVQGVEGEIRRRVVEADLVDCVVSLPPNLFFRTQIPVSLWFLTRQKHAHGIDRRGRTLFIDARTAGSMINRVQRVLADADVARISEAYRDWKRGDTALRLDGLAAAATTDQIAANRFDLTPGRYVQRMSIAPEALESADRFMTLRAELTERLAESAETSQKVLDGLATVDWE